jgi:hypothetical protein
MRSRSDHPIRLTRRQFLACCSALAASGASCATLGPDTRSAYALLRDPPLGEYQPILRGLIQTVLPCEDTAFPVTVAQIQARLLRIFRLERDPRFLLLQRSFVLFDQTDLFPHFLPLAQEEHRLRASSETHAPSPEFAGDLTHDRELHASFTGTAAPARFVALGLDRQRQYFDLWRRSRFLLRREFHATSRSLVMIAAYSMDEVWPAIGYAGPLLTVRGTARS